jgi:hypothetical protein
MGQILGYSNVLNNFVYTVYTPRTVGKLLQQYSMNALAKLYIEKNMEHGAQLYKELEALETILNPKSSRYYAKQAENTLTTWMQKIIEERRGQIH